jgi:TonB family protein
MRARRHRRRSRFSLQGGSRDAPSRGRLFGENPPAVQGFNARRRDECRRDRTGSGEGRGAQSANFPFSYFLAAIERKVSENWFSAVAENAAGLTCVVYFALMRDGGVSDVRLETSSGNAYFDRAATRAVKSAAPFPPLPKAFTDTYLGIHFTFVQKE